MIISHAHKFIFLKTAKTAGTSLEIALSGICGDDDIISPITRKDERKRQQISGRGPQHYAKPLSGYGWRDWRYVIRKRRPARIFYNHMPSREIRQLIPEDIWDSYYTFCFERNPFDKVVSHYFWVGRKYNTIEEFIDAGIPSRMPGFNVYSEDGVPVVDTIYKYEEMNEALQDISEKLGLEKPLELPEYRAKGNLRTDRRHYREILTDAEAEKIKALFSREIDLLGYTY